MLEGVQCWFHKWCGIVGVSLPSRNTENRCTVPSIFLMYLDRGGLAVLSHSANYCAIYGPPSPQVLSSFNLFISIVHMRYHQTQDNMIYKSSSSHYKCVFTCQCKRRHGQQEAVQVLEASFFLFLQLLQKVFDGDLQFSLVSPGIDCHMSLVES